MEKLTKVSVSSARAVKKSVASAKAGTQKRTIFRAAKGTEQHGKASWHPSLGKHFRNPIISPDPGRAWKSKATFNPAALELDGTVHLAYRAIGDDDVSVIGYAASSDGFATDEELEEPMYLPREAFEGVRETGRANRPSYAGLFTSGGGAAGGCEDPRLMRIDDRVYMTYVAYNGWSEPRVALTSISVPDFAARHWNWEKPVLISKPGVVNKNACLFPEKIKGKYVILHRVFPDILIDFVDDLDFDGKTKWLEGKYKISPRQDCWDSRKIGAGAPPIKTRFGWLLIYQGVGDQDPSRYKIGAMLLDLEDPKKVVARAKDPILEPVEWYENVGWKSGVVYPCGAVVKDGRLIVYYGGADKVVCAADADFEEFLDKLWQEKTPKLTPAKTRRQAGKLARLRANG
jgi:beta-1,2-mannobiose phosphorylase / 1,2-beta-oligomannan phosphorylase